MWPKVLERHKNGFRIRLGFIPGGQDKLRGSALAGLGCQANAAAIFLRYTFHQTQANTAAGNMAVTSNSVKGLEDPFEFVGWYAETPINHFQAQGLAQNK